MSDVVIRAEGLGKRYRLGERAPGMFRYKSLRDSLAGLFTRRPRPGSGHADTIWALKDVSFEVKRGEVVGIIGRNGAGKSTLLKILSRITEPTEGQAEIHGRVGSLLEVGTGFHPELTGRENIFLNGAILGMRRGEIAAKFDEIVAFAEVEKFIDTPVKHYSSGMYVRLAFSVAAHLETEILLVDEVLAVGDIAFQKKCLGKIGEVTGGGRTALFVSHSMSSVRALCGRAILLERGRVRKIGAAAEVIEAYLGAMEAGLPDRSITAEEHLVVNDAVQFRRVRLRNAVANQFAVYWKQPLELEIHVRVSRSIEEVAFGVGVHTLEGLPIFTVHHDDHQDHALWNLPPGDHVLTATIHNHLRPGLYRLHLGADRGHTTLRHLCSVEPVILEVLDHAEDGTTPLQNNTGLVNGMSHWTLSLAAAGARPSR